MLVPEAHLRKDGFTSEDIERELRQLLLMKERLTSFSTGDINIARTVSDLEGLLAALELTSEEWKNRFIPEWGELEIAYAVAMNDHAPMPNMTDPSLMRATRNMQALVQERVADLGLSEDQ